MAANFASRALPRALRRTRWPSSPISKRCVATAAAVEYHEPEPYLPDPTPALPPGPDRRHEVRNAKPFSDFLTDTFNRQHDYLRISLTERCNLRCLYCMPEEGIELSPNRDILTTAEIYYLSALFVNQGVNKIRLTGGEPTVRKDIIPLMQQLGSLRRNGLKEIALTTNGISLHRKLDDMVEAGLTGVNISLDTLDPHQFVLLTRRQGFDAVMKSINRVQEMNKLGASIKLKINCVAMRGLNDHQILPFVEMTRDKDIEVRFIEYMPFGGNKWSEKKMLPYAEILDLIRTKYPTIGRLKGAKNDTSKTWQVPGFTGRVGFITSMTHNFCGTCNRLRITSDGNLKVCLHGETEVSLRDLLRNDHNGNPMDEAAFEAIRQIELDRRKQQPRFADEEGWISKERELLEVIGAAVKRKKAKHAGIGERSTTRRARLSRNPISSRSSPWSNIALHLLHPSSFATSQARFYSSDSQTFKEGNDEPETPSKNDTQPLPGLASTFGFQSLSGLFNQPPRGRYSRPQRPDAEVEKPQPAPAALEEENDVSKAEPTSTGGFFGLSGVPGWATPSAKKRKTKAPTTPSASNGEEKTADSDSATMVTESTVRTHKMRASPSQGTSYYVSTDRVQERRLAQNQHAVKKAGFEFPAPRSQSSEESPGREQFQKTLVNRTADRKARQIARRTAPLSRTQFSMRIPSRHRLTKRPNPFAATDSNPEHSMVFKSIRPPGTVQPEVETPWGLRKEDQTSTGSILEPGSATETGIFERSIIDGDPSSKPDNFLPSAGKLTHVNSTGEAHMVDVGAKESTRRVAIAFGHVRFSNPEPFRLISENTNKKGDVLGVARIAGIMAAKRTSDLIPLCHPIPISKVEVDVQLRSPGSKSEVWAPVANGLVTIQAQVECTGPTGVEMEALSAVSGAALTVYDMCKAVDKGMIIWRTQVVYKSGGRSGTRIEGSWAMSVGNEYLAERGLETWQPSVRNQKLRRHRRRKAEPEYGED